MRAGQRTILINAAIGLAGIVLAGCLIWFLGPLIPGLEGATVRLALCAMIALGWAGYTVWTVLRHARRQRELEHGLLDSSADLADEAAALGSRFADALQALRGAGALHGQPWYVIIGPPGSGKTTALLNAGLTFPMTEAMGDAHLRGVGGTRNCEWWFTDRAVLIDTAGRYTTQDSDAGIDRAGWHAFLDLLLRTRPRQPLNGIIVAIPALEIAGAPAALRTAHARAIRTRVEELDTRLKADLPVYLLFTKGRPHRGLHRILRRPGSRAAGAGLGQHVPARPRAAVARAGYGRCTQRPRYPPGRTHGGSPAGRT